MYPLYQKTFRYTFPLCNHSFSLSLVSSTNYYYNFLTTEENSFYFQQRVGKNGKQFKIYKFKSMKGEVLENNSLLSNEEILRITYFGKFLRKYRIDEFSQFINVLKGDISIVGPRPKKQFF